jgi:hypothetical protein
MRWILDYATGEVRFFQFGSVIFDEPTNRPLFWLEGDRVLTWADKELAFTIDDKGRFWEPGCGRPLLYFADRAAEAEGRE